MGAIALHRPSIQLLLLDEPTNHLDLPSILWLQSSLLASGKTFIIVSHDEAFLNAVVDRIWEVDGHDGHFTTSVSTYSAFKHAKLLAIEQQRMAYDQQQKRHQRLTVAVDKLRAATKRGEFYEAPDHDTLQRDLKRDRAGRSGRKAKALLHFRDAEEKVDAVVDHTPLRLRLKPLAAGMDSAILVDEVVLAHPGHPPLDLPPISMRVDFAERVALVGFNGIGKSTLLRTIFGNLEAHDGTVTVGRELRVGNLMQEHDSLPRDRTPRDYLESITNMDRFKAGSRVISYGLSRH